jgi:hypothetical protein
MKRIIAILASSLMLLGGLSASAGPSQGGISSDNVEYAGFVPFEVGTSTGVTIKGDYMYLTSWKNISIYDISDPVSPQQTAILPVGFMFENEDVSINPAATFLLFSEQLPNDALHVYDIEDKTQITEIATLEGAGDHTTTCILKCKWAYGSDGTIVDLRDPANPKLAAARGSEQDWQKQTGLQGGGHDITEVKNGFVIASTISAPFQYLDVRNPMKPKLLAQGPAPDTGYLFHSGEWPRGGKDKFILMQGEKNFRPRCNDQNGPFITYDTTGWQKSKTFKPVDTFRVQNGTYADGSPAANGLGCSAHWFESHATFKNGGLVAVGYYEHGTRFLDVDSKGKITEAGYFLPHGGSTSAAYWASESKKERLVYAIDYTRGIDILRWNGDF